MESLQELTNALSNGSIPNAYGPSSPVDYLSVILV